MYVMYVCLQVMPKPRSGVSDPHNEPPAQLVQLLTQLLTQLLAQMLAEAGNDVPRLGGGPAGTPD